MTKLEAEDRATRIWPGVPLKIFSMARGVVVFRNTSTGDFHEFDSNGHPNCHDECKRAEEQLP